MSESKRFEITEYGSDYYIEIIDNEKELDESIDNPSQKLGLVECVDLLNEQQATIEEKSNVIILMGAFIKSKGFSIDDFDEWISKDWHNVDDN